MFCLQVSSQARFLGETSVTELAPECALPAALEPHVPVQIALLRVTAFATQTGERTC